MTSFSDAELLRVAEDLPAAPRLLVELGQMIRHPRVDASDVIKLLRRDAALVSRLIRMANSSVYGRAEPVGSIEEALSCIGFKEVHRLVGVVAATQLAHRPLALYGCGGERVRLNALFVAVIMEELAGLAGEDPASCYTVGLLRSIGKMALNQIAAQSPVPPTAFAASGVVELTLWEQQTWGVNNCEVAERILRHWRLPDDTVIAVRHHYHPDRRHNPIIHLLNLAAGAAEHRCHGLPGEEHYWKFQPDNFAKAGVDARKFQAANERAQRVFQRLGAVVG